MASTYVKGMLNAYVHTFTYNIMYVQGSVRLKGQYQDYFFLYFILQLYLNIKIKNLLKKYGTSLM